MKPIAISFTAFGPFPDQHMIDFERLGHHGLFLISGPTGGGKTTVLDAMVFALYGKAAGSRAKHTDRLRSDFADADTATAVSFEFEIGGRRYRVERSPAYERPKQRGEGTTTASASVRFSEHDGNAWKAVSTKKAEVDDRIAALIGLNAEQFQQVILLPQGRFAEVLRAESKERLKLLRALFDTGRFLDAVEILRQESTRRLEAANEADKDVERLFAAVVEDWADVVAQADAEAALALGIEFDEDGDPSSPARMDAAALDALDAQSTTLVTGLAAAASAANTAYDAAKKVADEAEQAAGLWDRRAELLRDQTALAETADADAARVPVLDRAAAANDLVPTIRAAERALEQETLARGKAEAAAAAIIESVGAEPTLDAGRTAALLTEHRHLEQAARLALAEFETAAKERRTERDALTEAARAEENRQQLDAEVARSKQDLPTRREAAQRAEAAAAGIEAAEAKAGTATDELRAVNDGITLDRQIAEAETEAATTVEAERAALAALDDARTRHISGLAARLAADLHPGDACPTCGSTDHPHPAEAPADAATAEDVDRADAALSVARDAVGEVKERIAALRATRDTKPPASELDAATTRVEAANAALDAALALAATAKTLRTQVTETEAFIDRSGAALEGFAAEAAAATASAGAARTAADACEERATAFAPDRAAAQERLTGSTRLIAALEEYDGLLATVATAAATHAGQRSNLDDALAAKGFDDDAAALAAAIDPADLAAERAALEVRAKRRIEVAAKLAELAQQKIPDERPDPTELVGARDAAEAARDEAVDAQHTAAAAAKRIAEARDRLGATLDRVQAARAEAEVAKTVCDMASGNTKPKIALESWVCSAYLERVTKQANHHLIAMTGGQYELQVGRTADGRKQGGLDLDVYDLHTGIARSVDTLSGGETFMASLSLALGLAEVVAGQQNLMLDALFIDEGFGSLDAETLDRATDVLHGLQTAGRMVGVITHVTEMQKELPTGIEVTKTEQGSTLRVEYPDS